MTGLLCRTLALCAALLALGAGASAHAQQAADLPAHVQGSEQESELAKKFAVFAEFEKNGGFVEYIGRRGSLEGFVLVSPEQEIKTVYVTPEDTMVMGILVDEKGNNVTATQLMAYRNRLGGDQSAVPGAENGSLSKAEQVYAATEKTAWVTAGQKDAPYIYMFMNVNCDHCKATLRDVAPLITAGKLQLRLVPFGSAEANRDGGAALLSSDDAFAAWQSYINGKTDVLGKDNIKAGTLEKIAANTKFVADHKLQGPPFMLYRRPSDGKIVAMIGRPKNTLALMADLLPPELPSAPAKAATP